MILECACGKMYRVRDDATNPPTKCPVCGGPLRAAAGSSVSLASPARVKELEEEVQSLKKERAESQERISVLERDLAERKSSSPGALSFENSEAAGPRAQGQGELRALTDRADKLQRELFDLRTDSERRQKEKDRQISEVRAQFEREQAERRKLETRLSGLEETHARALEGKEKTIQALDASLGSYRGKLEGLQKRLDAVELQRMADLNAFESRVRERDQKDRVEIDRIGGAHQKALTDLRSEMEQKIADKDRAISENRQALDREAGERRRLSEVLSRLQETADREMSEKDASITAQTATIASYKSRLDMLQKRLDDLEQIRRAEQDQVTQRLRSRENLRARLDEAGHLASDFDHSLDGLEAQLGTLRDRMKRVKASLQTEAEAESAAPLSLGVSSYASPPPVEEENAPPPALSQASSWGEVLNPAAKGPTAEPAPETPEPVESAPEPVSSAPEPVLSSVPKEPDLVEMSPSDGKEDPEPAAEVLEPLPARVGRVQEPSGIMRTLQDEPGEALSEPPEASALSTASSAPEPGPAGSADEEEPSDLPLISHPEEDEASPSPASEAKPVPKEQAPAAQAEPKKKPFLSRFSWNRKK